MVTIFLELVAGFLLLAIGSIIYWRVDKENGLSPRWRNFPGIDALVVLAVLGGWAGGASLIFQSTVLIFSD